MTAVPPASRPRRLRVSWTVGTFVVLAVMIAMLPLIVRRIGDADYWWHITTARWILDHHALPSHDLFTYTVPSHLWTDHEYLSELLMYGLGRVGGQLAISVAFGLITWAGFWFILKRIAVQPTHFVATAASLGLAAVAGVAVWGPRPQMITFALVCAELYFIERFLRTGHRGLYALPLIMIAWANLHGGFVIAFLFLGIAVTVELLRWLIDRTDLQARWRAGRVALVMVASAVTGLINPHGLSLYVYSWRTQTSSVQQSFIEEWQSPDFHSWAMRGFEAMVVLLIIGLALRRGRPTLFSVVAAVVSLLLALQSWRHIALFVATATPLLAWAWGPSLDQLGTHLACVGRRFRASSRQLVRAAALVTAVVALAVLVVLRSLLGHQAASTLDNYPSGAADYLDAHPAIGTHMFSDYAWGGYFIYRFSPQPSRRVFIFGEADLMGDTIMNQYVEVVGLRSDWIDVLNSHNVDYVIFEPNRPLTSALAASPNWHLVYSDKLSVIYVRS
ncbi:MAG: hypothetical protein M3Z57_09520 [Candidatus Dormibacteraeota bacterium]|nr:hypothetical protein [Candidatus Dormibacteraeota bacterium]